MRRLSKISPSSERAAGTGAPSTTTISEIEKNQTHAYSLACAWIDVGEYVHMHMCGCAHECAYVCMYNYHISHWQRQPQQICAYRRSTTKQRRKIYSKEGNWASRCVCVCMRDYHIAVAHYAIGSVWKVMNAQWRRSQLKPQLTESTLHRTHMQVYCAWAHAVLHHQISESIHMGKETTVHVDNIINLL